MDEKKELAAGVREKELPMNYDLKTQRALHELADLRAEAVLNRQERADIMRMRKGWSLWILACIVGIVLFDFLLVFLLGFGVMKFEGQWEFPAFIADGVIKIIGLAAIVVNFLFNKDSLSAR